MLASGFGLLGSALFLEEAEFSGFDEALRDRDAVDGDEAVGLQGVVATTLALGALGGALFWYCHGVRCFL